MLARRYEMPWRRAYEAYAGLAWSLAMVYFCVVAAAGVLPAVLALPLAGGCLLAGLLRIGQAVTVLRLRSALGGRSVQVMGAQDLARLCTDPVRCFWVLASSGSRCTHSGCTN